MILYYLQNALLGSSAISILLLLIDYLRYNIRNYLLHVDFMRETMTTIAQLLNFDLFTLLFISCAITISLFVVVIVLMFDRNIRRSASTVRKIRRRLTKRSIKNQNVDSDRDSEKESQKVQKYNRLINTIRVKYSENECVVSVREYNIDDTEIINKNKQNIEKVIRNIITDYQLSDLNDGEMIGFKK